MYDSLPYMSRPKKGQSETKFTFSFDIGYASIGWSVIREANGKTDWPEVVATGVVLFQSDDCLASKRREYRRMRRTIRSRRARIARIGRILEHNGLITREQREAPGLPFPYLTAARALQGKEQLNAEELWHVLRWYAHNRGYDGNVDDAGIATTEEERQEDTKREQAARAKMKELGTHTMAETVCAVLGLSLQQKEAAPASMQKAYKKMQMAFPRDIVVSEVQRLCEGAACLPKNVRELILENVTDHQEELQECGVKLPKRYKGSVLFGRLGTRFFNRIISRCPITWAREFRKGMDDTSISDIRKRKELAKKRAAKYAKVPKADCPDFYEYRFARILANVRVDDRPLSADERKALWNLAAQEKKFKKSAFIKAVRDVTQAKRTNLSNYFQIVPKSEMALIFRPEKDDCARGRAPYARPVLREVVQEVLAGYDPTRPARSLEHPDGENKSRDGVLYCLQDPDSEANRLLAERSIDQQTNNPLVRHRMLIFGRVLKEMIHKYADDDPDRVNRCVIEVAREVRTFAGKDSQAIQKELGIKMKGFNDAVKKLQTELPNVPLTATRIRKCRIAMDMNWRCPYTGESYGPQQLDELELEHIIPYATRNSNALHALVLTWPEVNKMKGKRTGLQFIKEDGGKPVPPKGNMSVLKEKDYNKLVEKLKPEFRPPRDRKEPDDVVTRRIRKRFLLVENLPSKNEKEFTPGQLTQSSQLMRMAAQVVKHQLKNTKIAMIPGRITSEMRKYWKTMGTLIPVVPEVKATDINDESPDSSNDETTQDAQNSAGERTKDKAFIRNITHLHHAVDACTLGLLPLLIPSGTNGAVWEALLRRKISDAQISELKKASRLFICGVPDENGYGRISVAKLPKSVMDSIKKALEEKRVVHHIPADMSGAKLNEQYIGFDKIENGMVHLHHAKDKKSEIKKAAGYVGTDPERSPRLFAQRSVLHIENNFGLALIGQQKAIVIPHINVYKTLQKLRREHHGEDFRVLRKGQLIKIAGYKDGDRCGTWRVVSIKDDARKGALLSLTRPERVSSEKTNWRDVSVSTLLRLKEGFQILPSSYLKEDES